MQGCWMQGDWSSQDTARTPVYKYTGTTGQLVALQHSCREGADGVNTTHRGVQRAANTSRGADTAQLAQPGASYGTSTAMPVSLVTVLLLLLI